MREYSEPAKRKIQLYFACNYLCENGKSHPQVMEILSEHEKDTALLETVADAAAGDKWRAVFNEAQRLTALGKNFEEVLNGVKHLESDPEIVHFICESWYNVQIAYAENAIEAPGNISEGIQVAILSAVGLIVSFLLSGSLLSKILLSVGIFGGIITWIYGRYQQKKASALKEILEKDYTRFGELI